MSVTHLFIRQAYNVFRHIMYSVTEVSVLGTSKQDKAESKTLESPLDCKEIQPMHSEGNQPWDFFGRADAKAETPVLWPPHAKS